jgi:Peptidase family U32
VRETRQFLESIQLPASDQPAAASSQKRFPDGAQYRVEIPSVEGPAVFASVLREAASRGVRVNRVSQGSGGFLCTSAELRDWAAQAAGAGVEVSIFARPLAGWGTGAGAYSSGSGGLATQARGADQLVHVLEDIRRVAEHGFRSVLVTDLGVLSVAARMRAAGDLPGDLQFKVSVQMGLANPAAIRLAADIGADTYNVPTDLTLPQLASIRAAVDIPLDIYVEAPDDLGGFMRYYEIAELVAVCAPVYLKFGLRNSPNIYPSGGHLQDVATAMAVERVRRAELGLELLARYLPEAVTSELGAADQALISPSVR